MGHFLKAILSLFWTMECVCSIILANATGQSIDKNWQAAFQTGVSVAAREVLGATVGSLLWGEFLELRIKKTGCFLKAFIVQFSQEELHERRRRDFWREKLHWKKLKRVISQMEKFGKRGNEDFFCKGKSLLQEGRVLLRRTLIYTEESY